MRDHRSRREFLGLTAAGVAGAFAPPWLSGAVGVGRRSRPRRAQREGLHDGRGGAARRGVRGEGRPVRRDRVARAEIKALAGKRTQTFDAKQMTIVPGFTDCHNHAGGTTLLYEVLVGNPFEVEFVTIASIIEKLKRQGADDAAGHVGRGLLPRRHEAQGQAPAQRPRSRPGVDRASGRRAPSRRAHVVLQQQGVRAGEDHEGHAESRRAARSIATRAASSTAA